MKRKQITIICKYNCLLRNTGKRNTELSEWILVKWSSYKMTTKKLISFPLPNNLSENMMEKCDVLVVPCRITYHPKTLAASNIYYLSFCGSRIWVWISWVLWLRVSHRCNQVVSKGRDLILRSKRGAHSYGCWQNSAPRDCWADSLLSLLLVVQKPPSVPCHRGFP